MESKSKPIYRIRVGEPSAEAVREAKESWCLTPWDHVPKRIFWWEGACSAVMCARSSGNSIQAVLMFRKG
jgi:hypothetical protein